MLFPWTRIQMALIAYLLVTNNNIPWWRHQMQTFSALLALCAGNSPFTGEFPSQRSVTRSFGVFFDLRLDKRLSKQSWGWWFRRHRAHYDVTGMWLEIAYRLWYDIDYIDQTYNHRTLKSQSIMRSLVRQAFKKMLWERCWQGIHWISCLLVYFGGTSPRKCKFCFVWLPNRKTITINTYRRRIYRLST